MNCDFHLHSNKWFDVFFLSFSPPKKTSPHTKKIEFTPSNEFTPTFLYFLLRLSNFFRTVPFLHTKNYTPTTPTLYRTRFAPTCRSINASWGTRMISDHFGWWTTQSLWRDGTFPGVDRENMSLARNRNRQITLPLPHPHTRKNPRNWERPAFPQV